MGTTTCTACGATVDVGSRFCGRCGAPVAAGRAASSPALPPKVAPYEPFARSELAGWWQRLGAGIVDGVLLLFVVGIPVSAALAIARQFDTSLPDDPASLSPDMAAFWLVFAVALVSWGAWEVLWTTSARMAKPGQRVAGFHVATLGGRRLGRGHALGRFAAKVAYTFPGLGIALVLVTGLTVGITGRRQALHDKLAGTVCVRTAATEPAVPPAPGAPSEPQPSGPFV